MKRLLLIVVVLSFVSAFFAGAKAYAQVPDDVQKAAIQGLQQFVPTISLERDHYGLNSTDNINDATLGEGIPYYIVSNSALDALGAGKKNAESKGFFVPSNGYIFPINVGQKQIGIGLVQYFSGKWQMVQVSSYTSFDRDFISAKKVAEEVLSNQGSQNQPTTKTVKLVCDPSYGLWCLSANSLTDRFIVPLKTNDTLGFKQNEKIEFKDALAKLLALRHHKKAESGLVGGGPNVNKLNTESQTRSFNLLKGVLLLLFIFGCILAWRKLASRHR